MARPASKAFEVTTELVKARLSNTTSPVTAEGGTDAANYFKTIYDAILEITKTLEQENQSN